VTGRVERRGWRTSVAAWEGRLGVGRARVCLFVIGPFVGLGCRSVLG
jgi:hypothetical protein